MQDATVLVIEDDPAINRLLTRVLTDEGAGVLVAGNGAEALEVLDQATPDAIVLDLQMPVMDGRTFYARLREHERGEVRQVPVLILSGVGALRARRELGAEAAIQKPFDIDQVVHRLQRLIASRSGECASGSVEASISA